MKKQILILIMFAALLLLTAACDDSSGDAGVLPDGDTDGDSEDTESADGDDIDGDDDAIDGDKDGDGEEEPVDVSELIADGIFWLENGEAFFANEKFIEAYQHAPENPQVLFGYAMSEGLLGYELLGTILGAVTSIGSMFNADIPNPDIFKHYGKLYKDGEDEDPPENFGEWFDETFDEALYLMSGHFDKAVELYEPLKTNTEFSIHFDHLPFYLATTKLSYIKGDFDNTDVYLFDASTRTMRMIFNYLRAHSWSTNVASVYNKYDQGYFPEINLPTILQILTYLLNYEDNFLTWRESGVDVVKNSIEDVIIISEDLVMVAEACDAEYANDKDQENDFVYYKRKTGGKFNYLMRIWKEGEEEADELVIIDQKTLEATQRTRDNLTVEGEPISFADDLFPMLATLATVAIGSGFLEPFNVDLGTLGSILSPSAISSLIGQFINLDPLYVNFAAWQDDSPPVPLRSLLPAWTTDQPEFENTMILEWECLGELADDGLPDGKAGLFCLGGEGAGFVDSEHFTSSAYEIGADGIEAVAPYIAFQDPTWAGLLYIDTSKIGLEDTSAYETIEPADQFLLNAATNSVLSPLAK